MAEFKDIKAFGISSSKFRELKYFCMQYEEKKQQVRDFLGLSAVDYSRPRVQSGVATSPVEAAAIKVAKLDSDIKLIEDTAREADPGICSWLLKSVTEGIAYEFLDVPRGRRQFYEARRRFFYLLAQKR